jgi:hypothetical protein
VNRKAERKLVRTHFKNENRLPRTLLNNKPEDREISDGPQLDGATGSLEVRNMQVAYILEEEGEEE